MSNKPSEFDLYIDEAADFARPILKKLRALFHEACPEIIETIKWGFPHFEHQGIVGSMAAFKRHVAFGFWKAKLMADPHGVLTAVGKTAMGTGKIVSVSELPSDGILIEYIREAVRLNESGTKVPRPAKKPAAAKKRLVVPADLSAALKKNGKAHATFEKFSPSHRKEYVEWITEAKQEETRKRRLATAVEWMAAGKPRNWKYQR